MTTHSSMTWSKTTDHINNTHSINNKQIKCQTSFSTIDDICAPMVVFVGSNWRSSRCVCRTSIETQSTKRSCVTRQPPQHDQMPGVEWSLSLLLVDCWVASWITLLLLSTIFLRTVLRYLSLKTQFRLVSNRSSRRLENRSDPRTC